MLPAGPPVTNMPLDGVTFNQGEVLTTLQFNGPAPLFVNEKT